MVGTGLSVNGGAQTTVTAVNLTVASDSKLPTSTVITIDGSSVAYHTSCSVPLFIGQVLTFAGGDLTVTGFATDQFDDSICSSVTTSVPAITIPDTNKGCVICGDKSDLKGGKGGKGSKPKITRLSFSWSGDDLAALGTSALLVHLERLLCTAHTLCARTVRPDMHTLVAPAGLFGYPFSVKLVH